MIPILYEPTETAFTSNGICRLRDCLSCIVTEERNGIYECDFDYPVDGAHFSDIIPGRIIAVEHDESNDVQPFDIVSYTKPLNGIVSFHCVHISYRLTGMVVSASNITSLADAFTAFGNSTPTNPFTFETDKTSTGFVGAFDGTPRPIRQILGGVEGSLLDAYGGEYEWDRWTVKLHSSRGTQKDFTIKYGVNLLDYNDETDYSGVYTTCIPYWKGQDENGLEIVVKGNKVDPSFSQYAQREICVPMDLSDKFESQPTTAQLEDMALARMLTSETYSPAQNITVDFLHLADMDEYERFEVLFKCKLCDTIRVFFPRYGMNANYKIVKTEYNVLDEKYTSLELGTLATSLADVIGVSSDSSTGNVSLPYVLKAGDTMTGDLIMGSGTDIDLDGESLKNRVHVVETGTSGSWRYIKWSDGRVELWGWFSQSATAYATNSFIIGSSSTTAYPFTITEPRTIATGQKIGTSGCIVTYDYGRTDYWSGIAHGPVTSYPLGSTQTITWTLYVNARWK